MKFLGNNITTLADIFILESSTAGAPVIKLKSTSSDANNSELIFEKLRADDGVAQGQNLGTIWFKGEDDGQNTEDYAYIIGEIDVSTDGQESGQLKFGVANHDGGNGTGLKLTGGSADNEVDVTIGLGAASVTTIAGDLAVGGDTVTFESANADDPHVVIKNTHNSTDNGARLDFNKLRADDAVEQGMNLGEIWFTGQDNAQNAQDYAYIVGEIDVGTNGQESGAIKMGVANHDGDLRNGLTATGGSVNDEVDVIIGNGAASLTTVVGTLTMGSTATLNNTGILQTATQPNITTLAGLTSFGAAGATTDIAAGDLTMYNAVNDGNPTISLGSSATNRFEIKTAYNSGTQTIDSVNFQTFTTSSSTPSNDGRYIWYVDEVLLMTLLDDGLNSHGYINATGDGAFLSTKNSTASSATEGGKLNLICDDGAAMGDDHRLGVIEFEGAEDASNTRVTGARIQAMCDAAWSASENGTRLEFYTMDGNAASELSLTLDSNLLATFAGGVTVTGTITGDVTGDLTGEAATVATIAGLAPNTATTQATQPAIESIGTDGDTLNILGDTLQMGNTTASKPAIALINQADDATAPVLLFTNQRVGVSSIQAGEQDDYLGKIFFKGYDDQGTPSLQNYASILARIQDATSGEESGILSFQIANHDGGLGTGLILTGGSANDEIDVTLGLGADSVVTIPGDIDLAGDIDVDGTLETDALTIGGAAVLAQATASAVGAVELATTAEAITGTDTARAVTPAGLKARISQIVNLQGYAVLEDDNFQYSQDYVDNKAPFLMSQDYGSGTINSSTEVSQKFLLQAHGFHVPFACTIGPIQVQIACSNAGNISVALVEYVPSNASGNQNDYPRTIHETVVVVGTGNINKTNTVDVTAANVDNKTIAAGSHLLIMVKGDGTSAGGTAIIRASIGLAW